MTALPVPPLLRSEGGAGGNAYETHLVNFCSLDVDSGTNMGMVLLCLKQMFSRTRVPSHRRVTNFLSLPRAGVVRRAVPGQRQGQPVGLAGATPTGPGLGAECREAESGRAGGLRPLESSFFQRVRRIRRATAVRPGVPAHAPLRGSGLHTSKGAATSAAQFGRPPSGKPLTIPPTFPAVATCPRPAPHTPSPTPLHTPPLTSCTFCLGNETPQGIWCPLSLHLPPPSPDKLPSSGPQNTLCPYPVTVLKNTVAPLRLCLLVWGLPRKGPGGHTNASRAGHRRGISESSWDAEWRGNRGVDGV